MGHLQTRKNTSKQEKTPPNKKKHLQTRKTPTNKKNTNKQEKTPPNKKNPFRARETPFKQGVSSDQMQKLTNGRSFRSRQGGCERWRVDIVY